MALTPADIGDIYSSGAKVDPYHPMDLTPRTSPAASFASNKLAALQQTASDYQASLQPKPTVAPFSQEITSGPINPALSESNPFAGAIKRTLKPQEISGLRQSKGDSGASQLAYLVDPGYRDFVDHFKNGAMGKLSDPMRNNFDQYALNIYYNGSMGTMMPETQALQFKDLSGEEKPVDPAMHSESWGGWLGHVAKATTILGAGGVADSFQGAVDTIKDTYHAATGQAYNFSDTDPLYWEKRLQKSLDPENSFEQTVSTAATQTELVASLAQSIIGPLAYPLVAAAGGAREVAQQAIRGEQPTYGAAGYGALKSAGALVIANKIAPLVWKPLQKFPMSASWGKVLNSGIAGGVTSGIIATPQNAVDVAMGKETPLEGVKNVGMSSLVGAVTASSLESARIALTGAQKMFINLFASKNVERNVQYEVAQQNDTSGEARKRMELGANPGNVKTYQEATPDERKAMFEVHNIAREKLLDQVSTNDIVNVEGKALSTKLNTMYKAQDTAGKIIGDIRANFDPDVTIDPTPIRNEAEYKLQSMGINVNPDGSLDVSGSLAKDPASNNAIKLAWGKMGEGDEIHLSDADTTNQQIGKVLKQVDPTDGLTRGFLGSLRSSISDAISSKLPESTAATYKEAMGVYADSSKLATEWGASLKTKETAGMSPAQFKSYIQSGAGDLRGGEIIRMLGGNAAGRYKGLVEDTEAFVDQNNPMGDSNTGNNRYQKNPYVTNPQDVKLQKLGIYTKSVEAILHLQNPASLGGDVKAALPSSPTGAVMTWLKNFFGDTARRTFEQNDQYLQYLIMHPESLGSVPLTPEIKTSSSQMADQEAAQLDQAVQGAQRNASALSENRLVPLKGGQQGVAGMDYPAEPQKFTGDVQSLVDNSNKGMSDEISKVFQRKITERNELQVNGLDFSKSEFKQLQNQSEIWGVKLPEELQPPKGEPAVSGQAIPGKGESFEVPIEKVLPPKGIDKTFAQHAPHSPPPVVDNIPLDVVQEGDNYRITDGVHRLAAALRRGDKTIRVNIP